MEYNQNDNEITKASEPAVAYEALTPQIDSVEIERECLPLEESKRILLDRVRRHYHPES